MNSSSIVAISRIISVSTSVAGIPPSQRDFKNTVFIWRGAKKGAKRMAGSGGRGGGGDESGEKRTDEVVV